MMTFVKIVLSVVAILYSIVWFNEASKANVSGGTLRFITAMIVSILSLALSVAVWVLL